MPESARVLILADDDCESALLGKRARGTESGKWDLLGGKVDEGETPKQAAIRELREEGGIFVEDLIEIDPYINIDEDAALEWINYCFVLLLGRHVPIKRNREHVHIKWFTRADWEKLENKLAFNQWLVFKQYFGL